MQSSLFSLLPSKFVIAVASSSMIMCSTCTSLSTLLSLLLTLFSLSMLLLPLFDKRNSSWTVVLAILTFRSPETCVLPSREASS